MSVGHFATCNGCEQHRINTGRDEGYFARYNNRDKQAITSRKKAREYGFNRPCISTDDVRIIRSQNCWMRLWAALFVQVLGR